MKILLLFSIMFLGFTANAQTYAKYRTHKKDTLVTKPEQTKSKPVKKVKPVKAVELARAEEPGEDFQTLMNMAGYQSQAKNYQGALLLYTRALNVSTEDTAWRALISRATMYLMLKNNDKAIENLTAAIEEKKIPRKRLAYAYLSRASVASENKDMALACSDLQKAKEMGVYPAEISKLNLDCD